MTLLFHCLVFLSTLMRLEVCSNIFVKKKQKTTILYNFPEPKMSGDLNLLFLILLELSNLTLQSVSVDL